MPELNNRRRGEPFAHDGPMGPSEKSPCRLYRHRHHATVALRTLGCKVNQYESSYLQEVLLKAGYGLASFRERADVYVVHSCAVTNRAAYETRQLLRRARRLNPEARIVAAGCDAQLEHERLAAEQLATHILGTREKMSLPAWLELPGDPAHPCVGVSDSRRYSGFDPMPVRRMLSGRARAFLKVQEGCDAFCTYCVVPYTRGASRSLPLADACRQAARLRASGYRETVLTGIHLGQWGRDLRPSDDLVGLLGAITGEADGAPSAMRCRLSSLEPLEWTESLMAFLSRRSDICPHFHVPLQSGDPEVLRHMGRPYTPEHYGEVIRELRRLFPRAALGADILVGFPGETQRQFENTVKLARSLPLTYFHVFPFSPRPGTPAAERAGRITGEALKNRARVLRELGLEKKQRFWEQLKGRWVEVLVEEEKSPGWWKGTSENYIQALVASAKPLAPGRVVRARLQEPDTHGFVAVADG